MAGSVIKGGIGTGYVYVNSFDTDEPVMKTVYGKSPTSDKIEEITHRNDRNSIASAAVEKLLSSAASAENGGEDAESEETISAEEARIEREKLIAEYESIRNKYERESEEFVLRARSKASEIYEKTKEMAQQTILDARSEAEQIVNSARSEAEKLKEAEKRAGREEGEKQGFDEGYVKALKKCKETLLELKSLAEQVTADKSELMMQYERQLFDTIFDICQRVTMGALAQKEKGIITRMIHEAGRKYKTSKNVKITLSKLDVSEEAEIDEQLLKDVFRNCENVEVEIQEDAPSGTLLIDDGSEITDASVMTQLKMVEQLGKGKYRDKSLSDMLQESQTAQKPKRGGRRRAASKDGTEEPAPEAERVVFDDDEDTAIPNVVYETRNPASLDEEGDEDDIEKQIERV
jgi:flagellar biosynthesis/type III secretory pathway protein FliH